MIQYFHPGLFMGFVPWNGTIDLKIFPALAGTVAMLTCRSAWQNAMFLSSTYFLQYMTFKDFLQFLEPSCVDSSFHFSKLTPHNPFTQFSLLSLIGG